MQNEFKLPVSYLDKKMKLENNIIEDLELIKLNSCNKTTETNDYVDNDSVYGKLFEPKNILSQLALVEMVKEYSYDKQFLKDTQKIIKRYKTTPSSVDLDLVYKEWNEVKNTQNFKDYYIYYNWNLLEQLNTNEFSLQFLTLYTLASPVFTLLMPIFMMIIPFLIIKIRGLSISFSEYYKIIISMLQNHPVGKAVISFNESDINRRVYLVVSVFFYFFSIYQNIVICFRFMKNIKKIHNCLFLMRDYLEMTIPKMDKFMDISINYKTYIGFYNDLKTNRDNLWKFLCDLRKIEPLKCNIKKTLSLGNVMKLFYQLYSDEKYNRSFHYSFYFIGYANNLENISNKKLPYCKFSKETVIKNMFYPPLINKSNVKNDISLKKMIITGPNASGKTTILKTAIINIIMSQQYGLGCYGIANIKLYKFIHCYLNIPDTSGRDSLFQAEARRCKEIIDCINNNKDDNHFCIFDELYSGTNPEEAVMSASAFMKYLSQNHRVDCIMTTHYVELCELLKKHIENFKMETLETNNTFEYTYKLVEGISKVKGGIKILNDMNYPKEIINMS
jgi:hypothetical protein